MFPDHPIHAVGTAKMFPFFAFLIVTQYQGFSIGKAKG
jgi:hypothetical protein